MFDQLKCIGLTFGNDVLNLFPINTVDKAQIESVECTIFNELFIKNKMRHHIAYHFVNEEIIANTNNCGYCGGTSCNIALEHTPGAGSNKRHTFYAVANLIY